MNEPALDYTNLPGQGDSAPPGSGIAPEGPESWDLSIMISSLDGESVLASPDGEPDGIGTVADVEGLEARLARYVEAKELDAFLDDVETLKELAGVQDDDPARWIKVLNLLQPLIKERKLERVVKPYRARKQPRSARVGSSSTTASGGRGVKYVEQDGWIAMEINAPRGDDVAYIDLAPFTARVEEEVVRKDGLTEERRFRVVGTGARGQELPALDLTSTEMIEMDWPLTRWGLPLEAVPRVEDHVRSAIFKFSDDIPQRVVYAHTGWTKVGNRWKYLHGGGVIDDQGLDTSVEVQLESRLAHYELPAPPVGAELRKSVRSVFGLLDLADPRRPGSEAAAAVAICLPFRAALGETLCNLWIEGLSGAFKTEFAANILQRFCGAGFDREKAPAGWYSTDNALEIQAFAAKDALLLIDDYRPPDGFDRPKWEAKATRLLRNAVDRRGRDRARTDGSLQKLKYPRGTLVVTAECGPPSGDQAAIGRTLILKVTADRPECGVVGTLNPAVLRRCAAEAKAGVYAGAMAGFIRWVAPHYESLRQEMRERVDRLAQEFKSKMDVTQMHNRTPEIVTDLFVGLEEFLRFAQEVRAVDAEEAVRYREGIRAGLIAAAHDQREHYSESDPIQHFFAMLDVALTSSSAILADPDGGPPEGLEAACGWKAVEPVGWRDESRFRIGWIEGEEIYLLLENAYAAAKSLGPLPFDSKTLSRRLKDKDLSVRTEGAKSNSIKKTFQGKSHRVLVLARETILPTAAEADKKAGFAPDVEEVCL